MNRNRQLNQLQNMDNRTARQDARMQFLQRQQQQPAMRQQQPYQPGMYERAAAQGIGQAFGGQPQYHDMMLRGSTQDISKLTQQQPMGQYPIFQGDMSQGQINNLDSGMGAAPGMPMRDTMERFVGQIPKGTNIDPGFENPNFQSPFPMPRGGQEFRGGYAFDQNALPGSSGNMGGISNAGYQSQAPNRMRGGIQGNVGNISNAGYQSLGDMPPPQMGLRRQRPAQGQGWQRRPVKGLMNSRVPQI